MSTSFSSREFNRDVSAAKRAAAKEPVVITDRGEPAFVLISIDEYRRMKGRRNIVEILQANDEIEFEPVIGRDLPRAAEL